MSDTHARLAGFLLFFSLAAMPCLLASSGDGGSISMLFEGPGELAAGPIMAFMAAFSLTVIFELFVAYAIISRWGANDRLLLWIIIANTLSWPFLILFAPSLDAIFGHEAGFIAGEAAVVVAEGLVLYSASPRLLGMRRALVLSLAANLSSAAASMVLTRLFYPILYS